MTFQKTTLVHHFIEKKGHSPTFAGIAHCLRCVKTASVIEKHFDF